MNASALRRALQPAGGELHLLNWKQSISWAFMGVLALGSCISSTNKRVRAEVGPAVATGATHASSAAAGKHPGLCSPHGAPAALVPRSTGAWSCSNKRLSCWGSWPGARGASSTAQPALLLSCCCDRSLVSLLAPNFAAPCPCRMHQAAAQQAAALDKAAAVLADAGGGGSRWWWQRLRWGDMRRQLLAALSVAT